MVLNQKPHLSKVDHHAIPATRFPHLARRCHPPLGYLGVRITGQHFPLPDPCPYA